MGGGAGEEELTTYVLFFFLPLSYYTHSCAHSHLLAWRRRHRRHGAAPAQGSSSWTPSTCARASHRVLVRRGDAHGPAIGRSSTASSLSAQTRRRSPRGSNATTRLLLLLLLLLLPPPPPAPHAQTLLRNRRRSGRAACFAARESGQW